MTDYIIQINGETYDADDMPGEWVAIQFAIVRKFWDQHPEEPIEFIWIREKKKDGTLTADEYIAQLKAEIEVLKAKGNVLEIEKEAK